jgi:SAM-dependent methyltransferase
VKAEVRVRYDDVADGFDRRYTAHAYAGLQRSLIRFAASGASITALEVGCGTGHWLRVLLDARSDRETAPLCAYVCGIDPSAKMLARARNLAPEACLVRAAAECLPWSTRSFDRVICVNAAHHFSDRSRAFAEAVRVLRPGGGVLIAGREQPRDSERWWVYDYFDGTRELDRRRYPDAATLESELRSAGFSRCDSFEADHIEARIPAAEALATGIVDRRYTSQLTVLTNAEFARGVERIRSAQAELAAAGETLMLVADIRYQAVVGWL